MRREYDREKKVIENSVFTAISSKGFLNFLPQGNNYVTAHNFNRKDIVLGKKIVRSNKIRFVWNGVMRYFDYQKQIILALANDNRYEILYYGDGPDLGLYRNFCSENSVHNVYFLGKYENSFKRQILSNTDFINNCYGYIKNAGNKLKYAVSNRFYDGIVYHIPQLVESSSYKTELVLKNNLGIAYTIKDNLADFLYKYYECIDENKFDKNCNDVLEKVLEEDNKFIERIDDFISP